MELLDKFGLNSTLFLQLAVFLVTYFFLKTFLFQPYLKAFVRRSEMTDMTQTTASNVVTENRELSVQFEQKARSLNDRISRIFDGARQEGQKQFDQTIQTARTNAETNLSKSRTDLQSQIQGVKASLLKEVPAMTGMIVDKLLGRKGN